MAAPKRGCGACAASPCSTQTKAAKKITKVLRWNQWLSPPRAPTAAARHGQQDEAGERLAPGVAPQRRQGLAAAAMALGTECAVIVLRSLAIGLNMKRVNAQKAACQHTRPASLPSVPGPAGPRRRAAPRSAPSRLPAPGAGRRAGAHACTAASAGAPRCWCSAARCRASEFERMRAPFQAGDFPGPGEVRLRQRRRRRGRAAPRLLGRPVFCLYPHQTRYVVPARCGASVAGRRAAARAPCWPPTWKPPSTRCGTRRRASAIASPWWAAASSACWWPGWPRGCPGCEVRDGRHRMPRAARGRALGVAFASPGEAHGRRRPGGARQRPARKGWPPRCAWRPSRPPCSS